MSRSVAKEQVVKSLKDANVLLFHNVSRSLKRLIDRLICCDVCAVIECCVSCVAVFSSGCSLLVCGFHKNKEVPRIRFI